ncbi:MAG: GNAT family N-acetyltransferase [Chloroflexi bacterium]|nr:GNAT family N-acetyltransferase [Chloroflexota bacterium]
MSTSAPLNYRIRDGLARDIDACLALDHTYTTQHVWQMQIAQEEPDHWEISFKLERLPRLLETIYPADAVRLQAAVPASQCFLIATRRDESELLGYLTMQADDLRRIGLITDVVVAREHRLNGVGRRLVLIAGQWARERALTRLMIETQTKNYPGISFCRQMGFVYCGFNDRYFPNQDIAVFFSQSLR